MERQLGPEGKDEKEEKEEKEEGKRRKNREQKEDGKERGKRRKRKNRRSHWQEVKERGCDSKTAPHSHSHASKDKMFRKKILTNILFAPNR